MDSGTKTPDILVIADQERLHGLFELSGKLSEVRVRKAFTIDEGLKSATGAPPSLLFVQSRMGGLSGEIIARHILLELKDSKTGIVLFCNPEEMAAPGNKSLSATIDISLPDDQLADQVESLVASFLTGENQRSVQGKKKQTRKRAPDKEEKPGNKASTGDRVRMPGQERSKSREKVPQSSMECSLIPPEPTPPFRQEETIPSPMQSRNSAARFREELDSAIEKTITGISGKNVPERKPPFAASGPQLQTAKTVRAEKSSLKRIIVRAKASRAVWIVLAPAVFFGISLLWMYYETHSTPEKSGESGLQISGEGAGSKRKSFPSAPPFENGIREADRSDTKTGPTPAKDRKSAGKQSIVPEGKYLKYTVRRGDTVFTILTKRFGLSSRMAENVIPEILEKNGITRDTVLSIGQEILIPEVVKIPPAFGPG